MVHLSYSLSDGMEITEEKLFATEAAEDCLFALGFKDFRVRSLSGNARLEITEGDIERLLAHREEILAVLKKYYKTVSLDLEVRG